MLSTPPAVRFGIAIILVMAVAALDIASGSEISFSIFYLVPVAFAAGLLSRRAGAFMAVVGAVAWGYIEIRIGRAYSAFWIPYWNATVRFGFFLMANELIDAVRRAHLRERVLSRTDAVTGIANARVFVEHANRVIAESRRSGRPFTITYVDLDKFKQVNDELGHSEGDRLLRMVAAFIESSVRTTDIVARLGGDEFAILMPDTGALQARVSLDRAAAAIADGAGSVRAVGATFGAVTFSEPPADVDHAVHQADILMYRGKTEGRGRILQASWPEPRAVEKPAPECSTAESTSQASLDRE